MDTQENSGSGPGLLSSHQTPESRSQATAPRACPVNLSTLGGDLAELIYTFNDVYFDSGSLTIVQGMFSEDVPSHRGSLSHHFFYTGVSPVTLPFSIVRVLNTHGKLGRLQFG